MSSENSEITDDSKQGPAHVSENAENMSEAVKTDLKGEQGDEGVNIAVEEKGAECDKVAAEQEGGIEEPMAKLLLESEATEAAENEAPAAAAENKGAASAAVQVLFFFLLRLGCEFCFYYDFLLPPTIYGTVFSGVLYNAKTSAPTSLLLQKNIFNVFAI